MTAQRAKLLEGLPDWVWEGAAEFSRRWDARFAELREFLQSSDSRYPSRGKSAGDDERVLAKWVNSIKSGRYHALSKERVSRLEQLPAWTWEKWQDHNDRLWNAKLLAPGFF